MHDNPTIEPVEGLKTHLPCASGEAAPIFLPGVGVLQRVGTTLWSSYSPGWDAM